MTDIPSTPADGTRTIIWVPAIADTLAPKLTEIDAVTKVDLSCYLTEWTPSKEQATISDERICTTQVLGRPGRKTPGLTLSVIDNTNSANETDANEAVETLKEGTEGFFIERVGVPYEEPFAVGQKVNVYPAQCGEGSILPPEANSVTRRSIPQFITANVRSDVALVA